MSDEITFPTGSETAFQERKADSTRGWHQTAARILGGYACLGGLISLSGWIIDVKRLTSWDGGEISIQPNASLAAALSGLAILCLSFRHYRPLLICAVIVLFIGTTALFQIIFGVDLGINTFLMFGREWGRGGVVSPGRMGPPGALSWSLIGFSLLLFALNRFQSFSLSGFLIPLGISFLSITGYAFGAEVLYTLPSLTVIAFQTATFIFAVSLGALLTLDEMGPTRLLREESAAGIMFRRTGLGIVILCLGLGFLRIWGERAGYYELAFGTAARTVVEVFLLLGLLWWTADLISKQEKLAALKDAKVRNLDSRLAGILRNLNDVFVILDREWKIVFANQVAAAEAGSKSDELVGRTLWDLFPERAENRARLESAMQDSTEVEYEIFSPRLDRWFAERAFKTDNDGLAIYSTDITEKKKDEDRQRFLFQITEKLRVHSNVEELIGDISETLGKYLKINRCLINEIDLEGDIETVVADYSSSGEYVSGKHKISDYSISSSTEMMAGKTVVNANSKIDPRTAEYFDKTYALSKELAYVSVPMMCGGQWVASLWCSNDKPRSWSDAEVTLLEGIAERVWNAIERIRADQARARLASIVESSEEAIVSKDLDAKITSWNAGAEKLFGYSAAEVIGQPITILIPEDRLDEEPEIFSRILAGQSVEPYETIRQRKDGSFVDVLLSVSPMRDATGKVIGASKIARDITARKRAEVALRLSEARFSRFMKHLPGLAWIKDSEGKYLYANDAALKAFNVTSEGIGGLTDMDLFPVETAEYFTSNDRKALISESGVQTVETLAQADGIVRYSLVNKFSIPTIEGKEPLVGGTAFDITEQKHAEEALRESESRLRLVTNSIPALISYVDKDERYIFVNGQYSKWFKKPISAFLGQTVKSIVGPSAYREIKPFMEKVYSGEAVGFEKTITFKHAGARFVNVSFVPDVDEQGVMRGFYGLATDLSELQRSRELLRLSQKRIDILTESFSDYAIFLTDVEGRIESWNPGARNIFGYTHDEIIGASTELLFTSEDVVKGVPLNEMRIARQAGRASDERWHVRKDGSRFFASGVMSPLVVEGTLVGYAKIATDLTDKKRSAEELQRAHDEMELRVLERTQELADLNVQLVAESHERRRAEEERIALLQKLVSSQEDERRRIARDIHDQLGQRTTAFRLKLASLIQVRGINEEVRSRLTRLQEIASMLDAEIGFLAWELRPPALDELGLSEAIEAFVAEWSRHYDIGAGFHSFGLAGMSIDPNAETQLYRITQEALNNIAKHADATAVTVLLERREHTLVLIVEDDGKGFDPNLVRTDRESKRGFGLAGMRERAALLNGDFEIETAPTQGTTIFVRVHVEAQTEL